MSEYDVRKGRRRDREERPPRSATCTFLSGVLACVFLGWLCWLVTGVVLSGIPEDGRADLAATGLLAATGVAVSAIVAARTATSEPFEFLSSLMSNVRGMLRRW